MSIEQRVLAGNALDASRFITLWCDGVVLGRVRRDHASALSMFGDVFEIGEERIGLRSHLRDPATRSAALATVARALADRGLLTRWRSESYQIGLADHGRSFFNIERAAVRFFGFTAQAVHLNGLVRRESQERMWIARRSPDKPIDPGMLDNLMGGGIGGGLSVEQTLVKECWEEAGIPADLARRAVPAAPIRVCREVPDGLHAELIHIYDLELPPEFQPLNQDGEVAAFYCVRLADVAAELAADAPYTVDAALVAIDCLRRKRFLR